jgi:hypothetical protein
MLVERLYTRGAGVAGLPQDGRVIGYSALESYYL